MAVATSPPARRETAACGPTRQAGGRTPSVPPPAGRHRPVYPGFHRVVTEEGRPPEHREGLRHVLLPAIQAVPPAHPPGGVPSRPAPPAPAALPPPAGGAGGAAGAG